MSLIGTLSGMAPLLILGIGASGAILSLLCDSLISRFLPRLGGLPSARARTTTAALTSVLCLVFALRVEMNEILPATLILVVLAVQLARIDLATHLLPNPLVLTFCISGVLLLALSSFLTGDWIPLARATGGAAILFLVYLTLAVMSPDGIGMGDVKLAAPVGLYLGHLGWAPLFYGGAFGFVLGGICAAIALGLKRSTGKAEVAFGPAMLTALLVTFFIAS